MPSKLSSKLSEGLKQRKQQNLLRDRQLVEAARGSYIRIDGVNYINFSSNDYLGLNQSTELIEAQHKAANHYGSGSGASPLVTGYTQAHYELEQTLCDATGHQAAMIFNSGFSANHGLMSALFDKSDFVVADKLIHASMIDGLRHSGAKLKRYQHNNLAEAEKLLQQHDATALVTESIFSMDGDCAPLAELSSLAQKYQTALILDDAHGFGILGQSLGTAAQNIHLDAQVVTFGKALGCQGAAVLGSQDLIDYLSNYCRDYIYSTALAPVCAAVATKAVQLTIEDHQRQSVLFENIRYFRQQAKALGLPMMETDTPIQGIKVGDPQLTLSLAQMMKNDGLWVGAIRSPTVPVGTDRLRITITAHHSKSDLDTCTAALAKNFDKLTSDHQLTDKQALTKESHYAG